MDRGPVWDIHSWGSKKHCIRWGSRFTPSGFDVAFAILLWLLVMFAVPTQPAEWKICSVNFRASTTKRLDNFRAMPNMLSPKLSSIYFQIQRLYNFLLRTIFFLSLFLKLSQPCLRYASASDCSLYHGGLYVENN